jgi:hypothetical protein
MLLSELKPPRYQGGHTKEIIKNQTQSHKKLLDTKELRYEANYHGNKFKYYTTK